MKPLHIAPVPKNQCSPCLLCSVPSPPEREERPKSNQDSEADYPIIGKSLGASICRVPVRRTNRNRPHIPSMHYQCQKAFTPDDNSAVTLKSLNAPRKQLSMWFGQRLQFRCCVTVVRPWKHVLPNASEAGKIFFTHPRHSVSSASAAPEIPPAPWSAYLGTRPPEFKRVGREFSF